MTFDMRDLAGKTTGELSRVEFTYLFCDKCRDYNRCNRNIKNVEVCKLLVDSGHWYKWLSRR